MSETKLSVIVQKDGYDRLFESDAPKLVAAVLALFAAEQAAEHPDAKLAKLEAKLAELDAKNSEQNSLRYREKARADKAEKLLAELQEKLAPANAKPGGGQ